MKKIYFLFLTSSFLINFAAQNAIAQNEYTKHYIPSVWKEKFFVDSVIIYSNVVAQKPLQAPIQLSSLENAVASYISFNTKEWGRSLYKSEYFKKMDYPYESILENKNSADFKNKAYYKHYLTIMMRYDENEIAACYVETYYSEKESKIFYLLLFEKIDDQWFLLGGNPYAPLKALSELKLHYFIRLLQGKSLTKDDTFNELLNKVYENGSINMSKLKEEAIPEMFDKPDVAEKKKKYTNLIADSTYNFEPSSIENLPWTAKSFFTSMNPGLVFHESICLHNNKRFISDQSKLDFRSEEMALASLYSTESKAVYDKYTSHSTFKPYWPNRIKQLDSAKSKVNLNYKISFTINNEYFSIVSYNMVLDGNANLKLVARFKRRWDASVNAYVYIKDDGRENYILNDVSWILGMMNERFARRMLKIDPIEKEEERTIINKLWTKSGEFDLISMIEYRLQANSPLERYSQRPH